MKYGSLFSGVEAAAVAWRPLGWQCQWVAEIDPFASAVLAHHYPDVPNLGDVNGIDTDAIEPVDLIVFGSPCQSFSVAGKRLGLDDPRGNMALVGLRVVGRVQPRWVVWENVPGVLSSDEGRDFGTFLGLLGELGYGFAYRVLDAQHFGVPQRRRRVFVVGHLGDWRPAAAVLFEPESLRGDTAPSRETGQDIAGTIAPGAHPSGFNGRDAERGNIVAGTVGAENVRHTTGMESGADLLVTHSLRADGFDASEDGTGRGTPLVAIEERYGRLDDGTLAREANLPAGTMRQVRGGEGRSPPQKRRLEGPPTGEFGTPLPELPHQGASAEEGLLNLRETAEGQRTVQQTPYSDEALGRPAGRQDQPKYASLSVRRLTPRECERLQGFPDDYTLVPYRGKPAADGPRYRAIGNSFAVPVVRWIGERVASVPQPGCPELLAP